MYYASVFLLVPPAKGAKINALRNRFPSRTSRKGSNNKCTTQAYSTSYPPQKGATINVLPRRIPSRTSSKGSDKGKAPSPHVPALVERQTECSCSLDPFLAA